MIPISISLFMATDYSGRVGPDREWHTRPVPESILVIACGALAQGAHRGAGSPHLRIVDDLEFRVQFLPIIRGTVAFKGPPCLFAADHALIKLVE